MLVPARSPSGRRALASALSPIARMTRSSRGPDYRCTRRNLLAGQFSHAAPGARHYGNRWGLWQHKFAGVRTRSFAELSASYSCVPNPADDLDPVSG
jgi:hypothetical protein